MKHLIYFFLIFLTGCTGATYFRENCEMNPAGWSKTQPAEFRVPVTNNKKLFNTSVIIRHTSLYKYNNLWLFIHITDPAGNQKTDTVECILSEPGGKWYGSGLGDMKTLKLDYHKGIAFPDTGTYIFRIEQAMRDEPLGEITDIGFAVEYPD